MLLPGVGTVVRATKDRRRELNAPVQAVQPRRTLTVFLVLTASRWLPAGFFVSAVVLLAIERGLNVAQVGVFMAVQGVAVFLLELPTSGLADAIGRKPLLLAAVVFKIGAGMVFAGAHSFAAFASAAALMGVYRALDSGPLEAWYVDELHRVAPDADPASDLARQGVVAGLALAAGSLASGALIALHPIRDASALLLPVQVSVALGFAHLLALVLLMREPPVRERQRGPSRLAVLPSTVRDVVSVVGDGVRLLGRNRVLRGLASVTIFWSFAMAVFETLQPVRLAEILGSQARSGAWMGPLAAAGWGLFALGSAIASGLFPRIGVTRTAILARIMNGVGAMVMGLVLTPVGLAGAYLATYSLHGTGEAAHAALLHREASSANRATVLSLNSMAFFLSNSVALYAVGHLATLTSTRIAMVAAGLMSTVGFIGYLPALRRERSALSHGQCEQPADRAS